MAKPVQPARTTAAEAKPARKPPREGRRAAKAATVAPHERAPERRKQEILQAALIEFSTRGFSGARVSAIIAHTNSNKSLIYSYFGSKEKLYIAVLEDQYARIRRAEQALHLADLPPVDAMRRLVEFTFTYYIENPHFVSIISNENLNQGRWLKRSDKAVAVNMPIVDACSAVLARGTRDGVFRPGIEAVDLYMSISALGFIHISNRHTLGIIFNRNLMAPAVLRRRMQSMTDMVLRYVSTPQALARLDKEQAAGG
jgi:AcrR family transcriptional regulator